MVATEYRETLGRKKIIMNEWIVNIIADSIGIAISPLPIVALILMLTSKKSKKNSLFFAIGWTASIFLALIVVILITNLGVSTETASPSAPTTIRTVISIAVGVLLIWLAIRAIIKRKKANGHYETPKWMESIDTFSPWKSLILGVVLAVANPKNLAFIVSSAVDLGSEFSNVNQLTFPILLMTFLSSMLIIIPVLASYLFSKKAEKVFPIMKNWLIRYNTLVLAILFFIMGTKKLVISILNLL